MSEPVPQRDAPAATDEAAGTQVRIKFADSFIAQRLPFDVPFYVSGNVAVSGGRLELFVYRVSSADNLTALIRSLEGTLDCVASGNRRLVTRSTTTPGAEGAFGVLVNALDPNYYYAFCFVQAATVPAATIDADVRRILAATISSLDTTGDLTEKMTAAFQAMMRDRITELGAGRPVPAIVPEGNLFAAGTPTGQRSSFGAVVSPFAEAANRMAPVSAQFAESLADYLAKRLAAEDGPARDSFRPDLVAALPRANLTLPGRAEALTNGAAFNRSAYDFSEALNLLEAAARRAGTTPAGSALTELRAALEQLRDDAGRYGDRYEELRTTGQSVIQRVALEARQVSVKLGSSVLSAELSRNAYVSLDAGIAYPWRLENMAFYAGTNIYFRPINKAAALRYKGGFFHRFALTVGVTTTIRDSSRRAVDLRPTETEGDSSNSLLLGAGLRVTSSIRVGAGALVFKESDPNPLIKQSSVAVTPYVGFATDLDVATLFRSMF